ncbi:MAG: hypothetical protein GEU79_02580 [Acidimicrobiia bacterium]|nr:hypothetical protein [Acidimicrobiia bacterium]
MSVTLPPEEGSEQGRPTADDILLDHLRRAVAASDPVPAEVLAMAEGAFIHRSADTQLARLLDEELVGVRGSEELLLTFTGNGVTLNLADDDGSLIGHVSPPQAGVDLESPDQEMSEVDVDAVGRFTLADITGPIRFHIHLENQDVVTFWVTI